jgi:DNA polymerase-3 subunit delta'
LTVDIPHPRTVFDYDGGEAVERAFLTALDRGRLHHAWLLVGPEGVGKATFAYRAARRLLGARPAPAFGLLGAEPDDPVCRQMIAMAHPDLIVLQRETEDGKARRGIPVDEARALPEFFAKSPATAPYRVAIIDAADDLNANAANAVLKTLEEPPERGVLLLVSHAPGGLLPTIRSRCRRLRFEAPAIDASAPWVSERACLDDAAAGRLLAMAQNAPGRAWRLSASGALEADEEARALLSALPRIDDAAVSALAEMFRHPTGAEKFNLFFNRLADNIHAIARDAALAGEGRGLDSWAEAWEYITTLPRSVEAVNLDRADAFLTALGHLRAIA